MKFVITEEEKNEIKKLYQTLIVEQEFGPMYSIEKVIDFPGHEAQSIYSNLISNRELTRNGQVVNQNPPQQITIKKTLQVDKNLWRSVNKNPLFMGYYGTLTFEINILIKDNKYKVTIDNFNFSSPHPQANWKLNPYPLSEPTKGMTQKEHWNFFKKLIDKISNDTLNLLQTQQTPQDF